MPLRKIDPNLVEGVRGLAEREAARSSMAGFDAPVRVRESAEARVSRLMQPLMHAERSIAETQLLTELVRVAVTSTAEGPSVVGDRLVAQARRVSTLPDDVVSSVVTEAFDVYLAERV